MNSTTTYWLCRTPEADPEGPFTLMQLKKMHEAGAVTADARVCRQGEEVWYGVDDELASMEVVNKPQRSYRKTRRVKTGGSGCAALLFFMVGLACCVVLFPIGILPGVFLMVIAALVDGKYGKESCCGACGNSVAATSRQCPHCRAFLEAMPMSSQLWGWLKQAMITLLIIIVLTVVVSWVVVRMQPQ